MPFDFHVATFCDYRSAVPPFRHSAFRHSAPSLRSGTSIPPSRLTAV